MKIITITLISSLVAACFYVNTNSHNTLTESSCGPEITKDLQIIDEMVKPKFDSTLNKELIFFNERSIKKNIGDLYNTKYFNYSDESSYITNRKRNICVRMHKELGGGPHSYDRFTVYSCKNCKSCLTSKYDNFKTESGIELGLDKSLFLKQTKFIGLKESKRQDTVIFSFNVPNTLYSAEYFFVASKLVMFDFGYETP